MCTFRTKDYLNFDLDFLVYIYFQQIELLQRPVSEVDNREAILVSNREAEQELNRRGYY